MIWLIVAVFLYISFGNLITVAWAVSDVQLYAKPRRPLIYYIYFLLWGPIVFAGLGIIVVEFLIMKGKKLYAKANHHEPRS